MSNKVSMSPLGFVGLTIVFVGVGGGAYFVGTKTKPDPTDPLVAYAEKFEAYQDSVVKPVLAQSDSLKRVVDSTKALADSAQYFANLQTGEITKLRSTVSVLRKQNIELSDSVASDTTLPPECDQCRRAVVELGAEVDSLTEVVVKQEVRDTARVVSIMQLNTSLFASNIRADSLEKVIINFPAPRKPNKFFGVELPRVPTQYVIVGGIAGFLIVR